MIATSNSGFTWQRSQILRGTGPIGIASSSGMACPLPARCFVVGDSTPGDGSPSGYILSTADGGKDWTVGSLPPGATFLNAISCPTAARCVAVGGGIEARGLLDRLILTTVDGGQTWISRSVPTAVGGLDGVSCPTASTCVATGFGPSGTSVSGIQPVVAVTSDGGTTWTAVPAGTT